MQRTKIFLATLTAGQVIDYIDAHAFIVDLSKVEWLFGDYGRDTGWFQEALQKKGRARISPRVRMQDHHQTR